MRSLIRAAAIAAFSTGFAGMAQAASWTLDGEASKLAFGSIKKNTAGEVHHFTGLSGGVDADGKVTVEIDLTTVETWIDIRNERMLEWVFTGDAPKAVLNASIDAAAFESLAPGETMTSDVSGTLSLSGTEVAIETGVFVARLSETTAFVTTDEMIMLSTADAGLSDGIDKLREIAGLDSITRVSPVTFRFVFNAGENAEEGAMAAPASTEMTEMASAAGDAAAGAKVFRKCKACHVVNAEKNRVGPHLVGIVGREVGAVGDFKYSKSMTAWGAGKSWTPELLSAYLAAPKKVVKGTKMAFAGLKKDEDLADIIAYLESEAP